MSTTTFRDLIKANQRNSFLLVFLFILFTAAVAMVLALAIVAYVEPSLVGQLRWGEAFLWGGLAAGAALAWSLFSYYCGAGLILGISGARPLDPQQDKVLYNVVEEMAIAAGVPMPRVYLIHDSAPNAFATGRDPKHAVVAITSGLRTKLNREELQAVIAHEMAHVRNFDIRLMLLLAVLIGTIVMLCDVFWQMLRFSGRGRSSSKDKDKGGGGGALLLILMVVAVVLALVAPLLAQIIQLAVSRQREYLADASAVELTRNPQALANALRKIDADPDILETANRGTAHLYIANPIKKFEARANSLFASHPPIKDRIARLEALVK